MRRESSSNKSNVEIPVLIVGGGPVGLCASILASYNGISSVLVEKHQTTSFYPKARVLNARTMEIFRQCGIEEDVRRAALPPEMSSYAVWAKTLADGEELERRKVIAGAPDTSYDLLTPSPGCTSSQEVLEQILLRAARARFSNRLAHIKFESELTELKQDATGVSATVLDHKLREEKRLRTQFVVAADGAHSRVRELLGIKMIGSEDLAPSINILFRADLTPWVKGRSINACMIKNSEVSGTLFSLPQRDLWSFHSPYALAPDERLEEIYTQERCKEIVRKAVGVRELSVDVIRVGAWTSAARYAERFADGRIFLVGDAAHEMPPAGGFGLNVGIQGIHNLMWKLAAVIKGFAGFHIVETYRSEREPVGRWLVEQSLLNLASKRAIRKSELNEKEGRQGTGIGTDSEVGLSEKEVIGSGRSEYLNELGMIFGAMYESGALVPDGTPPPRVANPVTEYKPTARPGCRAPHMWLSQLGTRISTLDLLGPFLLLLAGKEGKPWCLAGREISEASNIPLRAHLIGSSDDLSDEEYSPMWSQAFAVEEGGVVLIRPDGYVAWRSQTLVKDPRGKLREILATIL